MYSLHGLEALIRPDSGVVCQSLMVVSYCMPGSAHSQAGLGDLAHQVAGGSVSMARPSSTALRSKLSSAS